MEAATTPGLAHPPARAGRHRSRWAAIGAAVAVAFGGGGLLGASASDSAPGNYVAITPCRVVDTRPAPDNVGPRATPIGPAETYSTAFVGAVGTCNIPTNAVAVVLNLAVVNPTAGSYLYVPTVAAPITISYNLSGVDDLQLSAETLGGIFSGTIASK